MRFSAWFFGLSLLLLPVGPALKLMLGAKDMVWVDPTLIFALLAFCALLMSWTRREMDDMGHCVAMGIILCVLCLGCAVSGFLCRPSPEAYDIFREPSRFALLMIWAVTSYWFLKQRKQFIYRCAMLAVVIGILSGLYVELVSIGIVPAPLETVQYARGYMLRQVLWYHGTLIPRMGGLFVEAPPFGLFMLGMGVVFYVSRVSGIRGPATLIGLILSVVGVFLSLADQALLGIAVAFTALVLSARSSTKWLKPALVGVLGSILMVIGWQSVKTKFVSGNDSGNVRHIYQNSVGERAFHFDYGVSILSQQPAASLFGIGPGRYGEYVAETGFFPDSVTMQSTEPEILVEWGVLGSAVWIVAIALIAMRIWRLHGFGGLGLLFALIAADSFQANWKSEAAVFAVAALCVPELAPARLLPMRAQELAVASL